MRVWGKGSKNPDWELVNIEKEMEQLITQQQTDVIRERIAILQREHSRCIAAQESYWLQRSRLNWNLMGDQNTRFFHMTAVVRRRRNRIQAIQTAEGDWIVKEDQIRKLFVNHYKVIYKKDPQEISIPIRQFVDSIEGEIIKIPQVQMEGLERNPTPTEILWAVNALGPIKLPGPDGINAALIQQQWKHFGPTIIREVQLFFQTGVMKPSNAHSNLVLIPKIDTPLKVTDFRPISVCNIIYKIISKLLAKRMQPLMSKIISNAQTAFIPGRDISDNVILLREIIHSFKKPYNNEQ